MTRRRKTPFWPVNVTGAIGAGASARAAADIPSASRNIVNKASKQALPEDGERPVGFPSGERLQQVAAAGRLGAQIALVVAVGREDVRYALDDIDAVAFERGDL